MKPFLDRIAREPALISGLLLAVFNIFAVDAATSNNIITIVSGALPLILALSVRQQVTPVDAPQLGTGEPPPELVAAAKAVAAFLPAPIGEIFSRFGAEGAWLAVRTAQKALAVAPSQEQTDAAARAL